MPDVFISHAKGDGKRAAVIARALEDEGLSVLWDMETASGKAARSARRDALVAAPCVIVCWSRASAKSDLIVGDASQAYHLQKLIPVTLQACDPPMPFNMVASADLTKWRGERDDEYWTETVAEARRLVAAARTQRQPPPAPAARNKPERPEKTEPAAPSPRYKSAGGGKRRNSGLGGLIGGMAILIAGAIAAIGAGPPAWRYVESRFLSRPAQTAEALPPDVLVTGPGATNLAALEAVASAPPPPIVSAAPAPKAASRPPARPPSSAAVSAPNPAAPTPSTAPSAAPVVLVAMRDLETCMQQIARACDARSADFRPDGQFSAAELRLMRSPLFPDGAQVTQPNLEACKAGSSRRAMNSETGKAACAAIRTPAPD